MSKSDEALLARVSKFWVTLNESPGGRFTLSFQKSLIKEDTLNDIGVGFSPDTVTVP